MAACRWALPLPFRRPTLVALASNGGGDGRCSAAGVCRGAGGGKALRAAGRARRAAPNGAGRG